MTAPNIIRLPVASAALDRIVARDREANIAAEHEKALDEARGAMRFPTYYSDDELRSYCSTLETYGNAMDWQRADQMIHAINRRERVERNRAAAILKPAPRHRWSDAIAGGVVFVLAAWLWVAGVMALGGW